MAATRRVASRAALLVRALPSRATLSRRRARVARRDRRAAGACARTPPRFRSSTAPGSQHRTSCREASKSKSCRSRAKARDRCCASSRRHRNRWRTAGLHGSPPRSAMTPSRRHRCSYAAKAVLAQSTPNDLRVAAVGIRGGPSRKTGVPRSAPDVAGEPLGPPGEPQPVIAGSSACFLVDRRAFEAAGGLDRRARTRRGARRPLCSASAPTEERSSRSRRRSLRIIARFSQSPSSAIPSRSVGRRGARSSRATARPSSIRCALLPVRALRSRQRHRHPRSAPRWGDWHFGGDLARALRRSGFDVRLQTADQADSDAGRSCDVHLVLHGLAPVRSHKRSAPCLVGHQPSRDAHDRSRRRSRSRVRRLRTLRRRSCGR